MSRLKPPFIQFICAILVGLLLIPLSLLGQKSAELPSDSVTQRKFKKLDIFPAISYSPETSLTLGIIGIRYFDLAKGNHAIPLSNVDFLAVYTLKNQLIFESNWEFFTYGNRWRVRGQAFYSKFPDRNYGIGNAAAAMVVEFDQAGEPDTLNYLNFDSDRIKFSPMVLRQLIPGLYLGIQYDMEYLYNMEASSPQYLLLNDQAESIEQMAIQGIRSGLGLQVMYDSRDFPLNPIKGSLITLDNINYGSALGSDFQFSTISLDARHYINTHKNQTLALRAMGTLNLTDDEIPMRALARIGGDNFIRGYFRGTYQDKNLAAFEMEYRFPFWQEGTKAKLSQFWKRMGVVGFVGGAQVFNELSALRIDEFRFGAGAGLRILFNPQSRVNMRIDYAIGLSKGSDGSDQRQSGLYFRLGESF